MPGRQRFINFLSEHINEQVSVGRVVARIVVSFNIRERYPVTYCMGVRVLTDPAPSTDEVTLLTDHGRVYLRYIEDAESNQTVSFHFTPQRLASFSNVQTDIYRIIGRQQDLGYSPSLVLVGIAVHSRLASDENTHPIDDRPIRIMGVEVRLDTSLQTNQGMVVLGERRRPQNINQLREMSRAMEERNEDTVPAYDTPSSRIGHLRARIHNMNQMLASTNTDRSWVIAGSSRISMEETRDTLVRELEEMEASPLADLPRFTTMQPEAGTSLSAQAIHDELLIPLDRVSRQVLEGHYPVAPVVGAQGGPLTPLGSEDYNPDIWTPTLRDMTNEAQRRAEREESRQVFRGITAQENMARLEEQRQMMLAQMEARQAELGRSYFAYAAQGGGAGGGGGFSRQPGGNMQGEARNGRGGSGAIFTQWDSEVQGLETAPREKKGDPLKDPAFLKEMRDIENMPRVKAKK